jgi:fucose 4-O-acetylase-like acetyltransferase
MGTAGRELYLDNLKVGLIGLIIVLHAILGYSTAEVWTYTEFREVTLSPAVEIPLFVLAAPFGFFIIGLLFLVAGLFTGPSLERKGAGVFARDRIIRLGVPYVIYVLLVQPTVTYALQHPLGDAPGSYWQEWLAEEDQHRLDSGPLWFVGVLLVFSLLVAAVHAVRTRMAEPAARAPGDRPVITTGRLLALSALVAVASFPIRLLYPYGGESGFWDLNLWEWPACLAAFLLGIAASRRGWVEAVPRDLARLSRRVTVTAMVAMAALLLAAGLRDAVEDLQGGWHWSAAAFALVDGLLVVFGPVWLIAVAQRRLRQHLPGGDALARSAFGAFILQTPVLVGLAGALRPVDLPAEIKAVVVAALGVALSFALAWVLVTRVPGVRRIL